LSETPERNSVVPEDACGSFRTPAIRRLAIGAVPGPLTTLLLPERFQVCEVELNSSAGGYLLG